MLRRIPPRALPLAAALLLALPLAAAWPVRGTSVQAQEGDAAPRDETLIVATKEIPPFVFLSEDGPPFGLSIDVWEELASMHGLDYEYLYVDTVTEQIDAVAEGEADLAIAAITITREREERVDFTLPYYESSLAILVPERQDQLSLRLMMRSFFSPSLLGFLVIFGICVLAVAHVIWLVERRSNEDFPHEYLPGIGEALWWAVVTVTTVGYGDRTPEGRWGRVFALVWMLFGIILVAQFTATITSQLALQQLERRIERIVDLQGRGVATVDGSTSEKLLVENGLPYVAHPSLDEALTALSTGSAEAILYDEPVLRYERAQAKQGRWTFVGDPFQSELYGIALPTDSPLREPLNRGLLELLESGQIERLGALWLDGLDAD